MAKFMTNSVATDILEPEPKADRGVDSLRVDYLLESRHRFVSATPRFITVQHGGQDLCVAVPSHCPDCDFIVTSASGDLLFLVGSQRPDHDGEKHRGAVVVAHRAKNGVYLTDLWHETHRSFVKRICGERARRSVSAPPALAGISEG
jgi:hypothetical protein